MKKALAFSGGKDSWACLWLHAKELADIHVIWVNTGKNYPELLETIEKARALCPKFVEVRADRDAQNERNGLPSDIVPVDWTTLGQQYTGVKPVTVQSYITCCYQNIAVHLHNTAVDLGCTHLIRGQRKDESYTSVARDGDVVHGLVYEHPIEGWSRTDVLSYLRTKMELPEHFALDHSSMDCYDCTAYRAHSRDRVKFMEERHPQLFAKYQTRSLKLKAVLRAAMAQEE